MIALLTLLLSIRDFIYDPKNQLLWQIVNFVVFVAILIYLLRNKIGIGKVFTDRAASIRKELDKARIEKEEAERKLAEVEARLSKLDEEVAQMRAEADREADRETARIREAAANEAEKIKQMTAREIEGAMKEAFKLKDRLVFMDIYVDPEEHVYPMAIKGGSMRDMLLSKTERT